jgi:hypothetical protein
MSSAPPPFPQFKQLPLDLQKKVAGFLPAQTLGALGATHRQGQEMVRAVINPNMVYGGQEVQDQWLTRYLAGLGPRSALSIIWESILRCERNHADGFEEEEDQGFFDNDVDTVGILLNSQYRDRRAQFEENAWRCLFNKYKHLKLLAKTKPAQNFAWEV